MNENGLIMKRPNTGQLHTTAARGAFLSSLLRLASFLLSQLTVRFVSASAMGKASIPLELLLGTALFVGREGFRLALTKERGRQHNREQQKRDQRIINVSWLSVPTGALISVLALSVHLLSCQKNSNNNNELLDYKVAGM